MALSNDVYENNCAVWNAVLAIFPDGMFRDEYAVNRIPYIDELEQQKIEQRSRLLDFINRIEENLKLAESRFEALSKIAAMAESSPNSLALSHAVDTVSGFSMNRENAVRKLIDLDNYLDFVPRSEAESRIYLELTVRAHDTLHDNREQGAQAIFLSLKETAKRIAELKAELKKLNTLIYILDANESNEIYNIAAEYASN